MIRKGLLKRGKELWVGLGRLISLNRSLLSKILRNKSRPNAEKSDPRPNKKSASNENLPTKSPSFNENSKTLKLTKENAKY